MAQYDFGTIDPNTKSGTALATDLNSWRNALHSTHGGSSAPSYITAGMLWLDTTSANYELKLYDGAQSITVAVIDATNNVARVAVDPAETSYITSTTSGQIQHVIAGSATVTVNSTGVGIGTSSPASELDIKSANPTLTLTDSDDNGYSRIRHNTGSLIFEADQGSTTAASAIRFDVDGAERMRITSAGNVGIGTTSPASIVGGTDTSPVLSIGGTDSTLTTGDKAGSVSFITSDTSYTGTYADGVTAEIASVATTVSGAAYGLAFYTGTTAGTDRGERMRIDASGNLLVGTTTANPAGAANVEGSQINSTGGQFSRDSGVALYVNRKTSDGGLVEFRKDGTTVGSIGNSHSSGHIGIFSPSSGIGCYSSGIYPIDGSGSASDNLKDLGSSTVRWDDIYATNNVIQTSDRNEKQDIEELSEAERRVAVACKGLLRKYRWKNAVAEKGDAARIHFGIIAQDLQAAFAAEGLDAGRYAMFISSTWWEHEGQTYDTAEEAPEGSTERTRLGVRYPELLAFIIAAL